MSNNAYLSHDSELIVRTLQAGPDTTATLRQLCNEGKSHSECEGQTTFYKRLAALQDGGWIKRLPRKHNMAHHMWTLTERGLEMIRTYPRGAVPRMACIRHLIVDVDAKPGANVATYVPPSGTTHRPGALDYRDVPSLGIG